MDHDHARTLLQDERREVEAMLAEITRAEQRDQESEGELGDQVDTAQPLAAETVDDAIATGLREKLAAIERAEQRLADGTYGVSVRSGDPIPDARLEASPTAELTVEEAAADADDRR